MPSASSWRSVGSASRARSGSGSTTTIARSATASAERAVGGEADRARAVDQRVAIAEIVEVHQVELGRAAARARFRAGVADAGAVGDRCPGGRSRRPQKEGPRRGWSCPRRRARRARWFWCLQLCSGMSVSFASPARVREEDADRAPHGKAQTSPVGERSARGRACSPTRWNAPWLARSDTAVRRVGDGLLRVEKCCACRAWHALRALPRSQSAARRYRLGHAAIAEINPLYFSQRRATRRCVADRSSARLSDESQLERGADRGRPCVSTLGGRTVASMARREWQPGALLCRNRAGRSGRSKTACVGAGSKRPSRRCHADPRLASGRPSSSAEREASAQLAIGGEDDAGRRGGGRTGPSRHLHAKMRSARCTERLRSGAAGLLAAAQHVAYIAAMTSTNDIRRSFLDYFGGEGHRDRALGAAGAAQRSDPDVRQRRHGAVQERLHRARDAALFDRGLVAEMRPRRRQAQRSRQCRLHRAPSHLLRDARQFLVRRLFQGAGDRARLEPAHQGMGPRPGPADRHRLSHRRRGLRPVEEDRRPARERIIRIPTKDNFWAMGDNGPCGPCSEIFYDHGAAYPRRPARLARTRMATASSRSGTSSSCSMSRRTMRSSATCRSPSIDTGMGLERIAAVLQGVHDNFDTDTFKALIARLGRADQDRRRRRTRRATG